LVLHRNMQWFRGGLVFKARRLLYHANLGVRVIKKKNRGGYSRRRTRTRRNHTLAPMERERARARERERERESAGERESGRERETER